MQNGKNAVVLWGGGATFSIIFVGGMLDMPDMFWA